MTDGATFDVYCPPSFAPDGPQPLLVSVHARRPGRVPRYFGLEIAQAIADARGSLLLAPQFDADSGFQWLGFWYPPGVPAPRSPLPRYDQQLLAMVDAVTQRFGLAPGPFDLFGHSAGGQCALRLLYLYPERLQTVVLGAPGTITVPSAALPFPEGLAGLSERSGRAVDLGAVRRLRLQLFVGDQDVGSRGLLRTPAADAVGLTRLARARTLHRAWQAAGIAHEYLEVAGLDHYPFEAALPAVQRFLLPA
jgi:pimeloyl-ACP methyl ester carboxylesterase